MCHEQSELKLLLSMQEEIEIEATALRVGKSIAVVSVELRKTNTGKLIAQGRHTMYPPAAKISRL